MTQIKQHLTYWKLAYFRAIISMIVVGIIAWQISTSSIDGSTWEKMHDFDKRNLYIGVVCLMFKDLLSFLDKTISKMVPQAELQPEPEPIQPISVIAPTEPPKP